MGGKSKKTTVGYWYLPAFHAGLGIGPIDAFLEFRGGDKTAWSGVVTASGTISVNAPNLWGGEKDQGGIAGDVDLMFGEADQQPNQYLIDNFGAQQSAWRGLSTLVFKGGKYGAMNPYPNKASYKIRKITKGWDNDDCWYPEKAEIAAIPSIVEQRWVHLRMVVDGQTVYGFIGGKRVITGSLDFVPNGGSGGHTTVGRYRHTAPGDNYAGFIDNVVVTKAVRATSDFVPPRDPPSAGNDPLWSDVLICLRGDGADGSTSFADDKGNSWATLAAGITNSTEQAISGTGSIKVEGNGAISTPYSAVLNVGSHFTIDAWVRPDDLAGYVVCVNQNDNVHAGYWLRLRPDGRLDVVVGRNTWPSTPASFTSDAPVSTTPRWMNPAHILYYSRTQADMGRESTASINDASFTAAADWYYAQNFGLCTAYDPSAESVEEFEQRICRVAGCSLTRSLVDGQWYLDVANGEYDLESLPVLTDDDILEFEEQPTLLDSAVNSVSIKYFDPEKKEAIVTPPVQAPALISDFGTNHLTIEYLEIPEAALAARVAQRELLARVTPLRGFPLKTTRKPYAWRPSTYFRLQVPKRGISDMVCIFSEKSSGQLRSGAMTISATQDVYSVPAAAFVEVEEGVDTRPSQTPLPIMLQRAIEAPYIDIVASMGRADVAALPPETGFALAVARDPATSRDFTMCAAPSGGSYAEVAYGDFTPTALVNEAAGYADTEFTLAGKFRLSQVEVGAAVLWDDELCRVDAIDADAGTITLGRGCADTVPQQHLEHSRLWFYQDSNASDPTEYTDGETIDIKLLTNTGSRQLPEAEAAAMSLTFDMRQARPYPPANVLLDGQSYPQQLVLAGDLSVSAFRRDRLAQADQLVDQTMASIGPEAGTTYVVRNVDASTEVETYYADGITTWPHAVPVADLAAANRMEIYAVRDGLESWQRVVVEFSLGQVLLTESGDPITTEDGQPITME